VATTLQLAKQYDKLMADTFQTILGANISKFAQIQISLPLKMGGFGIRSALAHSPAAFVSSINTCEQFSVAPTLTPFIESDRQNAAKHLEKSIGFSSVNNLLLSKSQKVLSEAIDKSTLSTLLNSSSTRSKARIISSSGPHGSLVVNAPLAPARGYRLTSHEFSFFASTRLGLSNLAREGDKCNFCHKPLDTQGYHFSVCKHGEFGVTYRHNQFRDLIFHLCQNALWNPKLEVDIPTDISKLVPADVYIPTGSGSQPIAVDVTITQPLSKKNVDACSSGPNIANSRAEGIKYSKYNKVCSSNGIEFKPLSVEFFGRISDNTNAFIGKLSAAIANRSNGSSRSISKDIQRKIFVCLIRSSARAMTARLPTY